MRLIKEMFADIEKQHWATATWMLGYTIIFGLFPILISILVFTLCSHKLTWNIITDEGQFAIFSVAILSAGFYFVAREFDRFKFRGRLSFVLILGVLLLISTSIVICVSISAIIPIQINYGFLRALSITDFIFGNTCSLCVRCEE